MQCAAVTVSLLCLTERVTPRPDWLDWTLTVSIWSAIAGGVTTRETSRSTRSR